MAVRKQRWYPDTCGCIFEQTHDPDNPEYGVRYDATVHTCKDHADVPPEELYGVVYENPDGENRRKNMALRHLMENVRGVAKMSKPVERGGHLQLEEGVDYEWRFEGSGKERVLHCKLAGAELNDSDHQSAYDLLQKIYPGKKVVLEK